MGAVSYDLSITVITVIGAAFILLGIFYPGIAAMMGLDTGNSGHRFLSVLIGLALFLLLLVYRLAQDSMAAA